MSSSGIDLSSLLSVLGNGSSGIDVSSAVSAAISAMSEPEQQWEAQQTTLSNQTSALNNINSLASNLENDLNALGDPLGAMATMSASSSDTYLVSASTTAGATASNHVVEVNSLATTSSWYSATETSSSSALPSGSFTIQVGSGTATTIQIGSGVDTLDQLASAINSQNLGVTASVVNDASGSRLAIVSQTSGTAGNIAITNTTGLGFTEAQAGANASLTVDGIPMSSASNTVTGAINGVTLNLQEAAPGTQVNISVGADQSQIASTVSSFVSDYNSLVQALNSQFTFSTTNSSEGPLASDSVVRGLQDALLSAMNYSSSSSDGISTLGAMGISMNDDGTLTLDSSTLDNTIQNNFSDVQNFFQGTSSNGFANTLDSVLNTYTDPSEGAFTVDLQSISSENSDLQNQINTFQLYIASEQTTLTTDYSNAEIALEQLPSKISQINEILGVNSSNSNNG